MSELISGLIQFNAPVSEESIRKIARALSGAMAQNSQEFSNQWTALMEPRMRPTIDDAEAIRTYNEWLSEKIEYVENMPERMVMLGDLELSPVSSYSLTFCLGSRWDCLTVHFVANGRVRTESEAGVIDSYLRRHQDLLSERIEELENQIDFCPPSAWPTNRTCFWRIYNAARDCFPVAYERFSECWLKETVEEASAAEDRFVERTY